MEKKGEQHAKCANKGMDDLNLRTNSLYEGESNEAWSFGHVWHFSPSRHLGPLDTPSLDDPYGRTVDQHT
ncbi:hypothetical protein CR513_07747, partial [Mucuna pruriens]